MSCRNILKVLNQKPIAYYPVYRQITGSTTAGILLSQLMYWFSKKDRFFKTDADIIAETLLTEKELKLAKNKIKKLGFISVTREGLPAKTYYEIDWEKFAKVIEDFEKNRQTSSSQRDKTDCPKGTEQFGRKGQTIQAKRDKHYGPKGTDYIIGNSKTTSKTTTKITSKKEKNIKKENTIIDVETESKSETNSFSSWLEDFMQWVSSKSKMALENRMQFEITLSHLSSIYGDEVREVLRWASNHKFWKNHLIKPASIKNNYETMRLQWQDEKKKKPLADGEEKVESVMELIKKLDEV